MVRGVCVGGVYMWCGVYVEGGYVWLAVCGVWGADMWEGVCVWYICVGCALGKGKNPGPGFQDLEEPPEPQW